MHQVQLVRRTSWPRHAFIFIAAALLTICGSLRADTLVYADGDSVQGKLISQADGFIVFQSNRFGQLRVPVTEATVELGEPVAPTVDAQVTAGPAITSSPRPPADNDAPAPVTSENPLLHWWTPWKGRIATALELTNDATSRDAVTVDIRAERKWTRDEVTLNAHYEYRQEEEKKTADLLRGTAYWRSDFENKAFGLYRSTGEWNRFAYYGGAFAPYFLLQQEVGLGYTFLNRDKQSIRAGFSENFFNVWVQEIDVEFARRMESFFVELELRLPGDIRISERGVAYFSLDDDTNGWENQLELSRLITKTISVGLRHEYRSNVVDPRLQDYSKLRVILGYDF